MLCRGAVLEVPLQVAAGARLVVASLADGQPISTPREGDKTDGYVMRLAAKLIAHLEHLYPEVSLPRA
jgi:hypothetical protein